MKRIALLLALTIAATFAAPLAASASTAAEVTTEVDGGILWVEATVGDSRAEVVKITIRTPSKDGSRTVWQRCSFANSGAGTYRCGIDVGDGSLASKRAGNWVARVAVDGTALDRAYFSTSQ